VLYNTVSAEV